MKTKATFINGLNCDEPIVLTHVISCDNPNQTGEALHAFVELVNQHKTRIKTVIFIETAYLARHYQTEKNEEQLKLAENQWQLANQQALNLLAVPYQIKHWSEWVNHEQFSACYQQILQEYENNSQFKAIVNEVTDKFKHKSSSDNVMNYLLEECAGLFFITNYLTYPGKLNPALNYLVNHLKPSFQFIAYKLKPIPVKQFIPATSAPIPTPVTDYSPSFFAKSIAYHADNLSLSPDEQLIFIQKFANLCLLFKQKDNHTVQGIEHNESNVVQFSQRSVN